MGMIAKLIFRASCVLFTGYLTLTTLSIVRYAGVDETRSADVAIVLGASVGPNGPSPVFRERINHAVSLYDAGDVRAIIMTGGAGAGNARSDADVAREYAEAHGVPSNAIAIEENSTITEENLENAARLMDERGWATALVVSDPLHMKRAMSMARDLGLKACSSPTPSSAYQSWQTKAPFLAREEFFYVGYRLARLLP